MHQRFAAPLKVFVNFCSILFRVIVCKFYFIIGIIFANNSSYGHMGKVFFIFLTSSFIRFARKCCHY